MSSTDASKMKKTRATSNQPSKQPVKSHPSTTPMPTKGTPTADQLRLQRLISAESEYNHSAEVKGKVSKVMDVTGMNEDDVFDALETCNFDEEQAITRLVEAGPTGGQWKTTGKKKKGKGGEKQTDREIDAIAAPSYLRANGYDKEVETREGTNRAAAKSTRENYGGYVTVSEKGQSERGPSGRGNGRTSRGSYNNRGGRGSRMMSRGRGGRGGQSFGDRDRERERERSGPAGGFGRGQTAQSSAPAWAGFSGEDWDMDEDVSAPVVTVGTANNQSVSPVPPVEEEPELSYENANGSEHVFADIASPVEASSSVELTLPYSNTSSVPSSQTTTHLSGLPQDPAILSVISSSSQRQHTRQPRIRRVIKKGPSEIPTTAVEMPVSKYRTDLNDQFSSLGIGFGSSPTKPREESVLSVDKMTTPSPTATHPIIDSHLALSPPIVDNKLGNDEVRPLLNDPLPPESTTVNVESAVSQFSPGGSARALGGLVGSPTSVPGDDLRQLHASTIATQQVSEYVPLPNASVSVPSDDPLSLLPGETVSMQSKVQSEPPVMAAKSNQLSSSTATGQISLATGSSAVDSNDQQSALNKSAISSNVRTTVGITSTMTTSQAIPARTNSRSVPPPGMYQSGPAAPFLLPGAMPYMGYPMDYGELMRLQTPMSTRDMSGVTSSTGLVDSKYGRDTATSAGLLNPLYYPGVYMPPVFGLPYGMNFNPYQVAGKPGGATQFSQTATQNFMPQGVTGYEDGDFSKGAYGTGQGSVKGVSSGVQHRGIGSSSVSAGDSYKSQTYDNQKGGYGHSGSATFSMPPSNQALLANPYLSATTLPQQYQQLHGASSAHAQMMALDPGAHGAGGGYSGRSQHGSMKQSGKYSYDTGNWQSS